jgi:flagellar basal body-associated protein FliL
MAIKLIVKPGAIKTQGGKEMKKILVVLIVMIMVMALAVRAFAADHGGGMPAAHNLTGRALGEAVSSADKAILAYHVRGFCF